MKRGKALNAQLIVVPHDGGTNPRNPYDSLSPEERHGKIVQLCARIYLRMRSKTKCEE
jgi:hypothetical protein